MTDHSGDYLHRQERVYLLREGHFLGFGMGLLLSRWWWAALAWGVLLLALWGYSLRAIRPGPAEDGPDRCSLPAAHQGPCVPEAEQFGSRGGSDAR
jgi:hypothetical protein